MPESKKYWYIQLNVNFFDDDRIDWLCEQKNGYAYVVLYLKLCLKTANNNGILTRQIGDMIIPYNVDKIAEVTHMNVDIVRVALELYKRIGLIYEADENCNFMRLPEVPSMVGCITQAAIDKRRQREKKQPAIEGQCPDNVPQELKVKSKELRVNSKNSKKEKKALTRFTPPTVSEVRDYCRERNNSIDAEAFVAFYESKGWKVGSQPMKSWKAAVVTWEKRQNDGRPTSSKEDLVDGYWPR